MENLSIFSALGGWLRGLSLSGASGNAAAWLIVLAAAALPVLGLFWKGCCRWDWLLALAAVQIFAGFYLLVNPTLMTNQFDARPFIGLAAVGSVSATLLAWAVLRWLRRLERVPSLGRTLERLLYFAAALTGALAAFAQGVQVAEDIRAAAAGNTGPNAVLWPTNLVIVLLAAADLIPTLLGCAVLFLGGELAHKMETAPFTAETVALAERLSRQCGHIAAASVLICAGGNLLQFICLPFLHSSNFSVGLPLRTVLLAAVLHLLCRYLRQAKAVSDDNESII